MLEEAAKMPRLQKEAVSLKETWEAIEVLSRKEKMSIREIAPALVKSAPLLEKSKNLKAKVALESLFKF